VSLKKAFFASFSPEILRQALKKTFATSCNMHVLANSAMDGSADSAHSPNWMHLVLVIARLPGLQSGN
jgi:hypothetical protein